MGWGRYTTSDIERLIVISVVAIVLAIAMPAYVQLRDVCLEREFSLVWYQHAGLIVIALILGGLAVLAIGCLLLGISRLVEWATSQRRS